MQHCRVVLLVRSVQRQLNLVGRSNWGQFLLRLWCVVVVNEDVVLIFFAFNWSAMYCAAVGHVSLYQSETGGVVLRWRRPTTSSNVWNSKKYWKQIWAIVAFLKWQFGLMVHADEENCNKLWRADCLEGFAMRRVMGDACVENVGKLASSGW